MKVILKENIENLGRKGDIVEVAPGYARNYLLPMKMALAVTPTNMKMIEIEQKALQKSYEKDAASYQDLIQKLNNTHLSFPRKAGEKDSIFGSVTVTDVKEALGRAGIEVEKKKIVLEEPIKRLGNYSIPVKVYHEEKAEIKIEVVKEGEEDSEKEKTPEKEEKKAAPVKKDKKDEEKAEEKGQVDKKAEKKEPEKKEPEKKEKPKVKTKPAKSKTEGVVKKESKAEPVKKKKEKKGEEKEEKSAKPAPEKKKG